MLDPKGIYYQAHRGAVDEAPENTMVAFRHAWRCRGAIPETDLRTTADGALICLHDATLARTTNAPVPIAEKDVAQLPLDVVRAWDAGVRYGEAYAGERVPTFEELLAEMVKAPERHLYVEPKNADLRHVRRVADAFGVAERLLFVSASPPLLAEAIALFPGAQTMTWCGGTPAQILARFEELAQSDFAHICQVQMHLREKSPVLDHSGDVEYLLDDEFLRRTRARLAAAGIELQLRPWVYSAKSLRRLMALGVRWFVADAPAHFSHILEEAR